MKQSAYRPPAGTPFGDAYTKAELDLTDEATDAEIDWLEDHPLMWLRALSRLETHYQAMTGMDRMAIKHLMPMPGHGPTREYLKALADVKRKHKMRMELLEVIAVRREEVKSMISDDSITTHMTVGDLAEMMTQFLAAAKEDDYELIERSANGVLKMIEKRMAEHDAA